jgi:hypothetical protein
VQFGASSGRFFLKLARPVAWLLTSSIFFVLLLILYPLLMHPRCGVLLAHSVSDVLIPLPAGCAQTASVPSDERMRYFENERSRRGLIFKSWVICQTQTQTSKLDVLYTHDPHWLPSYVPATYQFRRAVIILPYAQPVPEGSFVIAEVCLMPWRRYISQIAGECDSKFSVWK